MSISFLRSIDQTNSTMVSPENSEDGFLPPIADSSQKAVVGQETAGSITSQTRPPPASGTGVALAPTPAALASFPALSAPQLQSLGVGTTVPTPAVFQQQASGATSAPKRRRVEEVSAATIMAGAPNAMLNGQQLAAAAAQAMQQQGRGRKKSQAQVDRRRERNRILARRTRLRKKFFFESLQKEVLDLQRENQKLKDLVKSNIHGEEGRQILASCTASEKMPPGVLEACGETSSDMESQDFNLVKSIQMSQHSFIITDPSLTDNPIVFASDDFLKLTGYSREQVLGRNCRFLQGTGTNEETVDSIRKALAVGDDVSVTIMNYTADGTPFWNKLFIAALRDAHNNIVNFIGVVVKVAQPEPGHPDHGKVLPEIKTDKVTPAAESTIMAIEDSVTAAVAAAGGQ